jgi:hypothetical protein
MSLKKPMIAAALGTLVAVGSFGSAFAASAEEASAPATAPVNQEQAKVKLPSLKDTAEYQSWQTLVQQNKVLQEQLKNQREINQQAWNTLKGAVSSDLRSHVKQALSETKTLRENNKALLEQLKAAKASKDKEKVQSLKQQIAANHQAIEAKLAAIKPDLEAVKQLGAKLKNIKTLVQPIRDAKKADWQKVAQLREQLKSTVKQAKDSRKQNNAAEMTAQLNEAANLLQQIMTLKNEIITQKSQIAEMLKQQ